MTRWFIGMGALIIAVVVVHSVIRAKQREERYVEHQAALAKFSQALKPGIPRKQVEDYLRTQNLKFVRYCCNQGHDVYATEARVGQEEPTFYCSGMGVYVTFEFTSIEPDRYPLRQPSDRDILRDVHLITKGEGCL